MSRPFPLLFSGRTQRLVRSTALVLPLFAAETAFAQGLASSSGEEQRAAPAPADSADSPESGPPSVSEDVEAPRLLEAPVPDYPQSLDESPAAPVVDLRLLIDELGRVVEVEIVQGGGQAFDEEAIRAARKYVFSPAKREGTAVASRVLIRVEFAAPSEPLSPAQAEEESTVPLGPKAGEKQPAPPLHPPTSASMEPAEEVVVLGEKDDKEKLLHSADSVTVVDLRDQKHRSSDMGEVLARAPGVVVRRAGGVGSDVRISLNGLYGRAVREFVDGVPLWMTAFPDNVSALPVNLFERVEVYRGVVPLRLAADALGGAINFVSDKSYENHGSISFQTGSFGTLRGTLLAQYRHEKSSFVGRVVTYADNVKNNYRVDVEVPDASGRLSAETVPHFHNAYAAYGVVAEVGFVDKPWAKRLLVRGFASGSRHDIAHNQVMSVPYGEPWWEDASRGAALIYDQNFGAGVRLTTTTTYSNRQAHLEDVGEYVYNWWGERVRDRTTAGEITSMPINRTIGRHAIFNRTVVDWEIDPEHVVLLSLTPLYSTQKGTDHTWVADAPDPLSAQNTVLSVVSGLGYELNLVPMPHAPTVASRRRRGTDFRLQNTFNVKSYLYRIDSTEALPAGGFRTHRQGTHDFGIGDGARIALTRWLFLKGSYEYSRRLPDPFEIFGDGVLVSANPELVPEVSHNVNFGPLLDWKGTKAGDFVALANVAYRNSHNMIVLLGNPQFQTYRNVYEAITWSGEGGLSWISPRRYMIFDWSATVNDSRNRSRSGPFAEFAGDPIPNRSPFGTSWSLRLSFSNVLVGKNRIEPFYQGRYTQGFFRSWESQGITEYKERVDNQTAHDVGITYSQMWRHGRLTNTFEVQNVTDAALFDDFGVQKPGRAFYWKVTGEAF